MSRGRPFQAGNTYGKGRPKGSPNKKNLQAHQLLQQHAPAIMATAINNCREDPPMLRQLTKQIVPRQQELPVKIGRLPMKSLSDLDRASEVTLQKAASGKLSLSDAQKVSDLIESRRRLLVTQDLEQRLNELQNRLAASDTPPRFDGTLEELLILYKQTVNGEQDEARSPQLESQRRRKP